MSAIAPLISFLGNFPGDLKKHLDAAPKGALDFVPSSWDGAPSETLTIRQQICHLRDIESDGYADRFLRVLNEEAPFLASLDTYELVARRAYDSTPVGDAFGQFVRARTENVQLLQRASPDDLARTAEFEGYGRVTLQGLAHFLCSHDQQHLAGIQWLIGMYGSSALSLH